jgi:hypothetical protein
MEFLAVKRQIINDSIFLFHISSPQIGVVNTTLVKGHQLGKAIK